MLILIEPYWNWNIDGSTTFVLTCSNFNRTILELKRRRDWNINSRLPNFNRTILELKRGGWEDRPKDCFYFNRTILELKPQEPFAQIPPLSHFNRTILELKLTLAGRHGRRDSILIEPYWNWNTEEQHSWLSHLSILIEPYWNWNAFITREHISIRRF